ncbi:oxygenase MpaB family protein [Actinomadura luteofluorescens]|uniref:oxygenase MpaB family protein n=1 Tax=Actinomadura luteofluorescens TaxID=46163 RepID=UPI003645B5B4
MHEASEERTDLGLFGPGSVTWHVMGEPVLIVGGIRALLLQALHPRTMWGTAQNSELMDPSAAWARLVRTVEFVRVRTYGTHEEVERVGRRVRRLHSKLTGLDMRTGETFPVDDPENLLWVHMGEVDSYLDVARRAGVPLTARDADAFVDEQRRAAEVVGLDPADVPATVADMRDYYAGMRRQIFACREAREGCAACSARPCRGRCCRSSSPRPASGCWSCRRCRAGPAACTGCRACRPRTWPRR